VPARGAYKEQSLPAAAAVERAVLLPCCAVCSQPAPTAVYQLVRQVVANSSSSSSDNVSGSSASVTHSMHASLIALLYAAA
jgi:hypothetical protein